MRKGTPFRDWWQYQLDNPKPFLWIDFARLAFNAGRRFERKPKGRK